MKSVCEIYPVIKRIYFLLLAFSIATCCLAVEKVGTYDTPTPDELRCVTFDHQGFLWIGTTSGIFRFDGNQFKQYQSNLTSGKLLTDNYIQCIQADLNNHLWIGTNNGITCLDLTTGITTHYYMPQGASQRTVYTICCTSDGNIWAGTDGGLLKLNRQINRFQAVQYMQPNQQEENNRHKPLTPLNVKAIIEDKQHNLYLGTWYQGLYRIDRHHKCISPIQTRSKNIYSLSFDDMGRLWCGSWDGTLSVINHPDNSKRQTESLINVSPDDHVYNIAYDARRHAVYVCQRSGIRQYRILSNGKIRPKIEKELEHEKNNYLLRMAYNERGIIAAITRSNKVEMYASNVSPVQIKRLGDSIIKGGVGQVKALYTSDGRHFIMGTSIKTCFKYDAFNDILSFPTQYDFPQDNYGSIARRYNGDVWIGNYYKGIVNYKSNGEVEKFGKNIYLFLHEDGVTSLLSAKNGVMWVGGWNGLSAVFPDNTGFNIALNQYFRSIYRGRVVSMTEDHLGRIWVCVQDNGLLRIDHYEHGSHHIRVSVLESGNEKYPASGAMTVFEDKQRRLWSITSQGELLLWDESTQRFVDDERYLRLRKHRVYAMAQDSSGNLWLACSNYFIVMSLADDGNIKSLRFISPRNAQGLRIQNNSVFQFGDTLYFGGVNEYLKVDTHNAITGVTDGHTMLSITDIRINDKLYGNIDSIDRNKISSVQPAYTRHITLPSNIRRVSFLFSDMTYNSDGEQIYAYYLDGYMNDWEICNKGVHEVQFENIPSGHYRLYLRVTDHSGKWQIMLYDVKIEVLPPWWNTWWMWIVYILAVAIGVYYLNLWYRNSIKTRNKLRIAKVFTNITHELLTPIAIITASLEESKSQLRGDIYSIVQHNTNRLTRLIRQILEVDKINAGRGKLLVSPGNLQHLLKPIINGMSALAERKHINVFCDIEEQPTDEIWFDADKLDKIVYNLLSNAIKYTPEDGTVSLVCKYDSRKWLQIIVSDTGIGMSTKTMRNLYSRFMDGDYRKMRTMGTGIGLSLTRDLVTLHHGKIDCQSKLGVGTKFIVSIPVSRHDYTNSEIDSGFLDSSNHSNTGQFSLGTPMISSHVDRDSIPENLEKQDYTVLIVEDNEDLLHIMHEVLNRKYNVLTAKNGHQAIETIAHQALDIVVSDVMMPVMDGIELTRAIKNNDDYSMIPIILLTAKIGKEDRREGYEAGADDYLTKPFDMETLMVRIDNFMANRERLRRKFMGQTFFDPGKQHYSNPDTQFIERSISKVKEHLSDGNYGREQFAADMFMSSSLLYKKLSALTGQNVSAFINSIKLKEACNIVRQEPDVQLNELYVRLGYSSASYFSRLFKKEFGMTFTEYLNSNFKT